MNPITEYPRYCMLSEKEKALAVDEYSAIKTSNLMEYFDYISNNKIKLSDHKGFITAWIFELTDNKPVTKNEHIETTAECPDIDVDFEPRIREDIKQYLIDKYGKDKVASIANYQLSKVKSCIKDAARTYNIPYEDINSITNEMDSHVYNDDEEKVTIDNLSHEELMDEFPKLKDFLKNHKDVARLFKRLRNSIKSIGRHAAGVVVSSVSLYDWIPLVRSKEHIMTGNTEGMDYRELSALGFVKMDILGLNNLQVVNDTMKLVKERHGREIDWNNIDIDSKEAYAVARLGDLNGIFQFESALAHRTIKSVKPTCFNDLSAINAIIRPGPLDMGMDEEFAKRKHDDKWKLEVHPLELSMFSDTYGLIVYQEDFMRCFSEVGGFTDIEVNKARKDLTKKESSKINEEKRMARIDSWKEKFVNNASEKMPSELASDLWERIRSYSNYGFCKAHSDAYTYTSFRELWLKAHYGIEFYTALLNNTDKGKEGSDGLFTLAKYISHINSNPVYLEDGEKIRKHDKVSILGPDINKSKYEFSIDGEDIRFGLGHLKGLSELAFKEIEECRSFESFERFIEIDRKQAKNKRVIIALIKSGALDSIANGMTRQDMYNAFLEKRKYKDEKANWNRLDIINNEKEMIKVSFSEINMFLYFKHKMSNTKVGLLDTMLDAADETSHRCLFRIESIEQKKSKSGKKYWVLNVTDGIVQIKAYYWAREKDAAFKVDNDYNGFVYNGLIKKSNGFYNISEITEVKKFI